MQKLVLAVFACSVLFISCSGQGDNKEKQEGTVSAPPAPPKSKLDKEGTQKLMSVISDYYELKDAFVATNSGKASTAANKLLTSTDSLRSFLQHDSSAVSFQPLLDSIALNSKQIITENDPTTERQRISFEKVSDAMYLLLKQADLKNGSVYRQYCPMAFNDKGAYWLSNEVEIKNPYFGKKMLECGEVTDSLK